jgi:protein-L-isoaspartate(D-aspartate) O-methyltransferase
MKEVDFKKLREEMVYNQIFKRGINDPRILEAFNGVSRHLFVPENKRNLAYEDYPLPVGEGQTISQPYIVALMTQALEIKEQDKVLEIGTGSGYQVAILSYLGAKVYSVERIASLAAKARESLNVCGYQVQISVGDGTLGWSEYSPYDKIIVTAASPLISPFWLEQLKIGGKLVLPLGGSLYQDLTVVEKVAEGDIRQRTVCGCVFVPLIGKYGYKE